MRLLLTPADLAAAAALPSPTYTLQLRADLDTAWPQEGPRPDRLWCGVYSCTSDLAAALRGRARAISCPARLDFVGNGCFGQGFELGELGVVRSMLPNVTHLSVRDNYCAEYSSPRTANTTLRGLLFAWPSLESLTLDSIFYTRPPWSYLELSKVLRARLQRVVGSQPLTLNVYGNIGFRRKSRLECQAKAPGCGFTLCDDFDGLSGEDDGDSGFTSDASSEAD